MKKNNVFRKVSVAGIALIFVISVFIPSIGSMTLSIDAIKILKNQIKNQLNSDKDLQILIGPLADVWEVQLDFDEPGGAYDYVLFGEKTDASDGQDSYDTPKSPPGFPPYIRAWFATSFPDPYDELLKEYKHYPDTYKVWNLTVQWTPSDYTSPTTLTISWDNSSFSDSEYVSVILFDVGNDENVADMINNASYSFTCPALALQHYKIICSTNLPPVANDDSDTVVEDSSNNQIDVLANDYDPEGDSLNITGITQPSHGTATYNTDYVYYTPESNYNGPDLFTYTISDGEGGTDTASINITVTSANDPPVANDDYYNTEEDTTLNVPSPGVLTNDTDPENDPLTAYKVTDPTHGTLNLNTNGGFTYTPDNNYNGQDTYTYQAYDGTEYSNTATVYITITPVNDPPIANADYYTTNEDTTLTITAPGILTNDTDPDNDPLTAYKITDPTHGTLNLNTNGGFTYTPDNNYNGQDTYTYQAYDGTEYSNTATVYITINPVNDPPIANDDYYTTAEDTTLTVPAPGVLTNDTDPENDPLTGLLYSGVSNGVLTFYSNGGFVYEPDDGFVGDDSFTYQAYDGNAPSNIATVHITVTPVNDPPIANDDYYTTAEDNTLTVPAPGVLSNDTDPENDPLTAFKVTDPTHGTLNLNTNGGFTYTPDNNYNGQDTYTYQAYDGTEYSNTATVYITITPVNDPPIANDDYYTTAEDTTLTITAPGILTNDTDPDNDPLTAYLYSGVSNGELTFNLNGGFVYEPDDDFVGADSFTYRAYDGNALSNIATVHITVTPVNDPPIANDDYYTTAEDNTLTVTSPGVLTNDTDPENDPLTAYKVTDPTHGTLNLNTNGGFTYTPDNNYNGQDTFTYLAYDGTDYSNTATVYITVTPVNDPPVANDDYYTTDEDTTLTITAPGVLTNDTDPENDPLTAYQYSGVSNGVLTFNLNGGFVYEPDDGFVGDDSFTYRAYDGNALSNIATVNITVTPVNDPPVANDDYYTTAEDNTLTVPAPGVLTNDTDPENDPLTAFKVTDPTHGTLNLNTNGGFTYTPDNNYNGQDTFTYRAYDGLEYSNTATVYITITPINDQPVANNDYYNANEDNTLTVPAPGVLSNDTDPDDDPLTAYKVTDPTHGTLNLNTNGGFTYTPDNNYTGIDSFTYQAYDGIVYSNTATVTITINPTNDPPIAYDDYYSTDEDTTLTITAPGVLTNDTDPENDPLTADQLTDVSNGTLNLNSNGGFTYTPENNYNGQDTFTYRAYDGLEYSNTATVYITINSVNDPPNIPSNPNPSNGATNVPTNKILSWTGGDPEGDTVFYDVYLGDYSPPPKVASNQTETTYDPPGDLQNNTLFYWQIISWDEYGDSSSGPIWTFTTEEEANQPPYEPSNPVPNDGATDININVDISWTGGDPNDDLVTYNVFFGMTSPPPKVSDNQSGTTYDPGTLGFNTTYYWQIVAYDEHDLSTAGPIWSFTTRSNNPPNTPKNPNPPNGGDDIPIDIILSWTGGDPDGDDVFYDVYFGDYSPPPKVASNQTATNYNPGTLDFGTAYYWQITSWDEFGVSTTGPIWNFTTRGNSPPFIPNNPTPANSGENVSINADLKWMGGDPDGDPVTYTVYFGDRSPPPLKKEDHTTTIFDLGTLNHTTTYYWKIIAIDQFDTENEGPIWHFTTEKISNREPIRPTVSGVQGIHVANRDYDYDIVTIDPDGDDLYYYIDWNDGTYEDWSGPYKSDVNVTKTHSWPAVTKLYEIRVKAKDVYGAESDWGKMYVFVLNSRSVTGSILGRFIVRLTDRFPIIERIFNSGPIFKWFIMLR